MSRLGKKAKRRIRLGLFALSRKAPALRAGLSRALSATTGHALLPVAAMGESGPDPDLVLAGAARGETVAPARPGETPRRIETTYPALRARGFRDAVVTATSAAVLAGGRFVLPDTLHEARHRVIGNSHLSRDYDACTALVRPLREQAPVARGIFFGGLGSNNWYHWLIEILPKALLVERLPEEMRGWPLLLPPEFERYPTYAQSFETLGLPNPRIVLEMRKACRVGHVITLDSPSETPFNMHPPHWPRLEDNRMHAPLLAAFRDRVLAALGLEEPAAPPHRRIFLARSNNRRAYDQDALIALLGEMGVETVYPERLDFAAQVRLMREAALIVGPSGAAWATLLFARPGGRGVIWTYPEYDQVACYSNLAALAGVDLRYVFFPADRPVATTYDLYTASYRIDRAALRAAVEGAAEGLDG